MAKKKAVKVAAAAVIPEREIRLLRPEEMPLECQRVVLMLVDQLIARGVTPEKAAYTAGMVLYGAFNRSAVLQGPAQ